VEWKGRREGWRGRNEVNDGRKDWRKIMGETGQGMKGRIQGNIEEKGRWERKIEGKIGWKVERTD
jgi:hypothetical protein